MGEKELCWCGLELCDAGLALLQLVFVPAELFGAYGVLLLERLDSCFPGEGPSCPMCSRRSTSR